RVDLLWLRTGARGGADASTEASRGFGENGGRLPPCPQVRACDALTGLRAEGERRPPQSLRGRRVWAVTGIARPARFVWSLEQLGAEVVHHTAFGDHHRFDAVTMEDLRQRAERQGLQLLTTEKDAVRLPPGFPAWVLELSQGFEAGEKELDAALNRVLTSTGGGAGRLSGEG